ncbi:UDP-N-acetylmuramoyl-tripeptide--D-alanyl-D-alanine ligase [Eubacterium uniforme]|uniref:UDP-N-acetylmuramoyl-tripeptide--D-alanyl-D-alanine ligase n=1 Tax=Eubacterium uniforme TaxID=39495 RepID=A0A1T4V518_9FIRM|nr:UDP-N-acetylmuramoyl-tripeptide--D-alanyl-D-alanine ligase [Eubacterium uniforme]SKA59976.1 UDP-N-acetylmuramoyl-tripeptide--D-alanyl-D-alanine ligase [Eubacterium uniforme]HAH18542.1 UDP-N-acetylmuramoyl-tripeptide--D-alanyl-D-alanine ligase [Eubacterium sp.]HAV89695.1 UDP-N-acetylmuramoyl-tripeptide--D-alanyl-D-alanine ligase [Eubacterium sp.]
MKNLTVANIAKACNGKLYNFDLSEDKEVSGVAIDSRKISADYLYIPFVGERVDGHDFIPDVFNKGALITLSEVNLEEKFPYDNYPYILVESTAQAIKDIAEYYRSNLSIKVVGITGSVGKTSTKEIIASVLEQKYKVLKTDGNFNNEIGLPLTIFRLTEEDEIAVLEMGISEFEEMHRIAKVAKPDVCVITNIGTCHLENLGDRDGVLKAKTEIFDYMNEKGLIVLNGDDDKLITIEDYKGIVPLLFGNNDEFSAYPIDVTDLGLLGTKVLFNILGRTIEATIPIPGKHMVGNALAASLIGDYFGLNDDEIKNGIESLKAVSGRNNIIKTDKYVVIDDCYNANPMSMKASLDVLSTAKTRKVAILGDMFELGKDEIELHKEIGKYAISKNIDVIVCVGDLSKNMCLTARSVNEDGKSDVYYFETLEQIKEVLFNILEEDDTVLVKASNGMHFKELIEMLTK